MYRANELFCNAASNEDEFVLILPYTCQENMLRAPKHAKGVDTRYEKNKKAEVDIASDPNTL